LKVKRKPKQSVNQTNLTLIMSSASDSTQKKYNTRLATAKAGLSEKKTSTDSASAVATSANKKAELKYHESSDDDASASDAGSASDAEAGSASDAEAEESEADTDTDTEDDEDDYISETEEEEEDEDYIASADEGEVDEELAQHEYKKFLSELFPSKYMTERANAAAAAVEHKKSSNTKCPMAPKKKSHRRILSSDEEEEEQEEQEPKNNKKNPMKNFNISFIINDRQNEGGEMSPTEALYDETWSDSSDEEEAGAKKRDEKIKKYKPIEEIEKQSDDIAVFAKMKSVFENLPSEEQENPIIKKMIDDLKAKERRFLKKAELKSKKQKIENTKKLKTLLRERDVMNDLQYFNEKMTVAEQESALQQIEEIKKHNDITKPYRLTLLDAAIPSQYKAIAYRKISSLRNMEPGGGDYYKMKNWVDTFMQIPFGHYKNLPITIADGVEKCHEFMDNAKQILDQAVYGLNDAKLQIMQMVGQWIVNPSAIGTAIAIKGPMGTGKTTLVKEGISKILGRDFVFIALGGATDSSFLEGHSYTYEGSSWGKIVDLLIKCKSMNPVIYFDELDKISDTPKGEEIAGILTHLTDTAQNNQFHDRYFSEIEFDLSRCLFIFSYNDESKVNKILLDRMYRIQTQGYNQEQKTTISNKYLLPKICDQVKFNPGDITISDETLHYIITNYTDKEDGVRTLKRCLEIIYTKLNLYRLMRPDTNIFESEMSIKVEFPMQVTTAIVDKLIKKVVDSGSWHNMYM
jgi:ATP-dependent Lon protease